ncbi:hypothetical protein RB5284 [Rhodopirellula baltica SH 1]|uniref:Uncharacterized protein n=1 Tax=Rhodopirellula baltica (strain DSM 10527 / NCIMB 13988 / SH1) TaxID=243090 RepID=Q7UGD5_RHOBA|nr:hypothetical protein RB5284 [Rhodopirellula baltica SH 1]
MLSLGIRLNQQADRLPACVPRNHRLEIYATCFPLSPCPLRSTPLPSSKMNP